MASPSPDSASPQISERFALIAMDVERYVLPWIFFWLAWRQMNVVYGFYLKYLAIANHGTLAVPQPLFWAQMTRFVLLACLLSFFGLTLFISRRPAHLPKNLAQIIIPLMMSYYFFLYSAVPYLPLEWRENLVPPEWQVIASSVAIVLAIIGYSIAFWGLFYLRRSFALFVAVREVVSGGPYAYVRHPMYLGYIFEISGLVLSSGSVAMVVLAAGFLMLAVMRAHLEEARLVEACPAYHEYMQRTGFFFPHFRRHTSPAPGSTDEIPADS